MEVLCTKQPEALPPTLSILESNTDRPPELVPVDITNNTVTAVAGQLSGGAGPGGMDSVSLQHCLLRFRAANGELRLVVANFTEWLSNGRPPWDAY